MIKSYLYMLFFQLVIKGEHDYIKEKESLRIIAALKQLHGKNLTRNMAEEIVLRSGFLNSPLDNLKILSSYLFYLRSTAKGEVIEFVHKPFQEYLLAEYYIKNLLSNNKYQRLNIGIPSKETIIFLDGLIDLITKGESDISLELKPNDADTLNNKGVTLYNLGMYHDALKCFDTATEIRPSDTDAWNNMGAIFYNLGRYDESLAWGLFI